MDETDDNVTQLRAVPKPKASDEVRVDVIQLLEKVLALAREGDVDCVFIVTSHADGTYSEAISKTLNFRQMVGQIEVAKQNWIGKYLASLTGKPIGSPK